MNGAREWWRRVPRSPATIQDAATLENPADGGNRRTRFDLSGFHLASDRGRTVLAQDTLVLQPSANRKHLLFDCRLGTPGVAVQGEWLPVEFLELAGELRIAVALSLYPAYEGEAG